MRKDKELALNLRKLGKSYNEIRAELGISKGTLSDWLSNHPWSKELTKSLIEKAKNGHAVRIKQLNNIRGEHLKKLYKEARNEAIDEFETLKHHPLFISGLMIYWGEGNKITRGVVRITNTEPAMVRLFVAFLTKICRVETVRIKASLLVYPDLDEVKCREYWSLSTGIDARNFTKSTLIQGRHKTRKLGNGVCIVGLGSAYLKEKVLIWLKLLPEHLLSEIYYAGIV